MISEGIGGIIFSKNIAKQITRYAEIGLNSTAFDIQSGIDVKIFINRKDKSSIYTYQTYMGHLLER